MTYVMTYRLLKSYYDTIYLEDSSIIQFTHLWHLQPLLGPTKTYTLTLGVKASRKLGICGYLHVLSSISNVLWKRGRLYCLLCSASSLLVECNREIPKWWKFTNRFRVVFRKTHSIGICHNLLNGTWTIRKNWLKIKMLNYTVPG